MKILILNSGSSSLKYQLYNIDEDIIYVNGQVERIGLPMGNFEFEYNDIKKNYEKPYPTHKEAIKDILDSLIDEEIIASLEDINAVGHRVVQGGPFYTKSAKVDDNLIKTLDDNLDLAPLHNPAAVLGIKIMKSELPNTPMVAVFDTSYHQKISEDRATYAIKKEYTEDFKIKKYGAHGTNHNYIAKVYSENYKQKDDFKIISAHLGNGASLAAIRNSECVNTTMGFTPLDGLVMGTRTGTVDPGILPYLHEKTKKSYEELIVELNKSSGLLGMCGYSDFRDIMAEVEKGNRDAILAVETFTTRIAQYIGQYYIELEGLDAIVFTAGIGQYTPYVRQRVIEKIKVLDAEIDSVINNTFIKEKTEISTPNSKVKVFVVPADEEYMIAYETANILR